MNTIQKSKKGFYCQSIQTFGLSLALSFSLFCGKVHATKTVVQFNDEERIHVKISDKSMNRLSVDGDRIVEVIGVNENVSVEKDAQHGHMFIKVTEGSREKLELTLITEGGLVQDLTLEPTNRESTTIVLKTSAIFDDKSASGHSRTGKHHGHHSHYEHQASFGGAGEMAPSIPLGNTTYQDTLIDFMKILFLGSFSDEGTESCGRASSTTKATIHAIRGFSRNGFIGEIFEVSNPTQESLTIQERDFYVMGDLALALTKKTLAQGQSTTLYVIRRAL